METNCIAGVNTARDEDQMLVSFVSFIIECRELLSNLNFINVNVVK